MNPGYLSYLLFCILIILLACGWKEQIIKGVSHQGILIFLISWLFCSVINVELFGSYRMNMCYLMLLVVTLWIVFRVRAWTEVSHFISVGLLLVAAYILLKQLFSIDPIIIKEYSFFYISFFLCLMTSVFVRHPLQQVATITIGLFVGEAGYIYLREGHLPFHFGQPRLYDQWLLVFLGTRFLSELFEQCWKRSRLFLRFWLKQ